jgi:hypothetical protein
MNVFNKLCCQLDNHSSDQHIETVKSPMNDNEENNKTTKGEELKNIMDEKQRTKRNK